MIVKWPDCGKGVNLDLMPEELALGVWSACKNMRFRNGSAERFGGMANVFGATTVTPYFIDYFKSQTSRFWVHAGLEKVFADDGFTRTEITPGTLFTGTIDDRWTSAVINSILVLNNGVDVPYYWTGNTATDLTSLTGWDATWRAYSMVSFKDYLIALNVTKGSDRYPSMVKWSASAVPGSLPSSWDETDVTKDAGEVDLSETSDEIVDALKLGDSMVIYKQRSMYLMTFIGAPFIFRFQKLPYEYGILARGCVTDTPLGHVVLTNGDVVLHSGQAPQSIADGVVRNYIFSNISSENYDRAFVCTNPQKYEVLVCFPSEGSSTCDKAAVWNWQEKSWGLRDLQNVTYGMNGLISDDYSLEQWAGDSNSWASDSSIWNENQYSSNQDRLLFSRVGNISAFDVGNDDFGTNFESYLERSGISFDDPQTIKLMRGLWPKINATSGVSMSVTVSGAFAPKTASVSSGSSTYTVGTDYKTDMMVSGRFLTLRLTNTGTPWSVKSVDFDVVQSGGH